MTDATPGDVHVSPDLLRAIDMFSRLDDGRLSRIAAMARLECVPAGVLVVRENEPADDLRMVVDGRVAITIESPGNYERVVTTVSSGELLGWSALRQQSVWLATAKALKNTTLLAVSGHQLLDMCEADHELGFHVMRGAFDTVAQRLQDSWLQLLDMFSQ